MNGESNYQCEHGAPCAPGGHTECPQCPKDPARVKYRPTDAFHERTMSAMNAAFPKSKTP